MTSDVRYASGEVPQVGDEVRCADEASEFFFLPFVVAKIGPNEEAKSMEIEGDVLHDADGSWVEAKDCVLNRPRFDPSTLDTAGVFHHSPQQPAPPAEKYVPTWGPEWEYVDGTGAIHHFKSIGDGRFCVRLVQVSRTAGHQYGGAVGGEYRYQRDGKFLSSDIDSPHDIVSQRPRTPAPVEASDATSQPADVPQESAELTALRERLAGVEEHERQTHERLGAILGTDDSLEECAKRLKADRDATKVQWQSLHDEREEQYAALRRAKVKFMRFGKQLEAVCPSEYSDMFQSAMPEDVIQEAEKIAEACAANADNHDDVSADEMQNVSLRLLDLRHQYQELQKAYHWKGCVNDELSHHVERLTAEHASALALVADIRAALGDNGKRMQPELIEYCRSLSAAEAERDEARAEAKRYCDQYSEAQRQRSMAAKSLEYAELEISRLQNERNDLGDCEIQLRADLARAKEDGERMREAVELCRAALTERTPPWTSIETCVLESAAEAPSLTNEWHRSHRQRVAAAIDRLSALAPRDAGAEENHFADAGKMVAELRRQSLEAHMRGDLNTADRIATLIGDELPSKFEKDDLKA